MERMFEHFAVGEHNDPDELATGWYYWSPDGVAIGPFDTEHAVCLALTRSNESRNESRVDRANRALEEYIAESGHASTALVDLLTDLRHTFIPEAFDDAMRVSAKHYNAEREDI